ncbi:5-(carboxyamino)imidazole ribonucleotide mutase [Sedimentibacter sp. MB31-C6]|uniref:5-(carboxyamino)imidazole ribonucleotide mutase n=1 Tax=Sedimentibacter sp. MB31-C6 TaxID=3109366 RepID=UPI002DDD3B1A|nr:5-(carboxyamino)imidazole ribonucleotide mutase [Sedimentibacter sp. MB36-C1]WSI03989.1 5-(carboxyamino)imidazole ribonucleotide mutase [Sedimentibacter sp. MB36-C1]
MKVAIIMGSDSDFPVVEKGYNILKDFGVAVDVRVISAHRTPEVAFDFAKQAEENGYEVIIGAAGKAAHLPGVLAGCTSLPVIGLPIKSSELDGIDALLAIVQMPPGVPVATVAINGADNAALLAIQILSVKYEDLRIKFKDYKNKMAQKVIDKNIKLNEKLSCK